MNESSIQVTIAGRTYPLTVAEGEAMRVREAAGKMMNSCSASSATTAYPTART